MERDRIGNRENTMKYGWIYYHPLIYDLFCILRYGRTYQERYSPIYSIVDENSSFLDICAGTSNLYETLRKKKVSYTAVEINPKTVNYLRKRNFNVLQGDLLEMILPSSDYVFMGASLYQFYNCEEDVIKKLRNTAQKKVILVEPIDRFVKFKHAKLKWISRSASIVNGCIFYDRYNFDILKARLAEIDCMALFSPNFVEKQE